MIICLTERNNNLPPNSALVESVGDEVLSVQTRSCPESIGANANVGTLRPIWFGVLSNKSRQWSVCQLIDDLTAHPTKKARILLPRAAGVTFCRWAVVGSAKAATTCPVRSP